MNIHEFHIERLRKQIKRIEENPDPTKLKSNKLLYELQLAGHIAQLEALRQGKPQTGQPAGTGVLFQAMGFVCISDTVAEMSTQTYMPKYLEMARIKGLPVDVSCDMAMGPLATWLAGEEPAQLNFPIIHPGLCNSMWLTSVYRQYMRAKPGYHLDLSFDESEANLKHVVNQLGEYIEICEKKFPGVIKYDESRLIELQACEEAAEDYYKEIYEMQRHKPAPLAGKQAFRQSGATPAGMYPDPRRAVEYAKVRRDEIAELVEKGIAAVPGEKLRLMWAVTRPWFMDPFPVLEKHKAAVLVHYGGFTYHRTPLPHPIYGGDRKLIPLEKVAAKVCRMLWSGTGTRWVDNMMWICQDLQLDAIINYNMLGCTATLGLKKLVEDRAGELGIPVLQLEGKQWDSNYASEETITTRLDEFAQMCLSRKGLD